MIEKQSSYRQIMKATSIFGGVQVITIFSSILRAKFVAIFLGPVGMGISSLLVSGVTLINTISGMGLNYSAVRDISQAHESGDSKRLSQILIVFRKWLWLSCLLGSALLIIFSPLLSQFTFGNKNYTWSFVFLSVMLIFSTLTNGNTALLQGTRKLKYTAQSAIIGSLAGLFTSIPLYYFLGTKGIVPALIISAATTFGISAFFARRIKFDYIIVSRKESFLLGGEMVKLGAVLVAGQLFGAIVIYSINAFVRNKGGLVDVGLYQAGTSLTNQSIGLVFTAMAVDYFPRLSAVCNDKQKVNEMVNQQSLITILLAFPIIITLIVFAPLFIHILLSPKFYAISDFIRWLAFGTFFSAPTVVIGYIALAKGDKRTYFLYGSFLNSLLSLLFYIGGYLINGLIGMAVGFFLFQLTYILFIGFRFYQLYGFLFSKQFLIIFVTLTLFIIAAMGSSLMLKEIWGYIIGITIICISLYYSLKTLNHYLDISLFIKQKLNTKFNKKSI
jgi:O-antigen/teichoic acid export membrane protein